MAQLPSVIPATALASATSANGTDRTGATLIMSGVMQGTLVADTSTTIVTGSVVSTITWEGSQDGSTWVKVRSPENTAPTTITATATRGVSAPAGLWGYNYGRVVMTLSGAATAAGDLTAATYGYRPYWR